MSGRSLRRPAQCCRAVGEGKRYILTTVVSVTNIVAAFCCWTFMYRGLPPISTLRAFEAAARLRGFSAASKELSVTHSAVSQQIRALEELVGYTLFYRSGNEMLLTEQGKRLADRTTVILNDMALAFPK